MTSDNVRLAHEKSIREGTLKVLNRLEAGRQSLRSILRDYRAENAITTTIFAGIEFLSISIIRFRNTIDFYLSRGSGPLNKKKLPSSTRNLLRIAIYQFYWTNVPLSVIIDYLSQLDRQCVPIMKRIGQVDIGKALARLSNEERLSIDLSHPTFLVRTMLDNLGENETIELLADNNNVPSSYIRPNLLLSTPEIIEEMNEIDGIDLESNPVEKGIFRILTGLNQIVKSVPFVSNKVLIQDKASYLTARVLDPKPGEFVWDACAAPGMKTQLLWELMKQEGRLVATEINPARYQVAKDRSKDLGLEDVEWRLEDASKNPVENADKILIDAPCTSTGMLRSHPSYKWRLNKKSLFSIMTIQNKILEGVLSAYSRSPGTEIVYATCSILPHEGESQIDSVIDRYNVELVDIPELDRAGYTDFACSKKVRRLFPHTHRTDGFFVAKMRIMP
ncbi:MAG: hypothetical protein KAR33_00525 [Candidatus Thorarchaeota archaeon]|nr:hypothetical protein [Candidatus Thorarchaeota archaeon]